MTAKKNVLKAGKAASGSGEMSGLFATLDRHFGTWYDRYMWGMTIFALLMALGMFQGKVSLGNDDALYVVSGYRMGQDPLHNPYLFNAPLYIFFLAFLTRIFGLNLLLLKAFSVLFFAGSFPLFFKAFKNKIPPTLTVLGMLMLCTNWLMLEYASYTYTEAFFLLLYGLLFYLYSRYLDLESEGASQRKIFISLLLIAFVTMLNTTARNVAVAIPLFLTLLFLVRKKYKAGLIYAGAVVVFVLLRELLFKLIWPDMNQYEAQGNRMLQVDYYNAAKGTETVSGLIDRFFINCEFYTERFLETLGFISPFSLLKEGQHVPATLLLFLLIGGGLVMAFIRKNNMMLFASCFVAALLGASFFALQTTWAQHRLIAVYTHLIIITGLYFLYQLTRKNSVNFMQVFVLLFFVIVEVSSLSSSLKRISENIPVALANLKGDKYKGYTPDWVNFLKASEWCSKNLPEGSVVASRKEPMSFLYGNGFHFYPVYSVPDVGDLQSPGYADAMVEYYRKAPNGPEKDSLQVDYFILAQLRLDLKRKIPGRFVNTVHNALYPIEAKYPGCLKLLHTEGKDEMAQVVQLDYNFIDSVRQVRQQAPVQPLSPE